MNNEFLEKFRQDFNRSPSNSEADNELVRQIINTIVLEDKKPSIYSMTRCLLGWQTKKIPRYFKKNNGDECNDEVSARWSPGYHRIDTGLKYVENILEGSKLLDPFAGSGSMMFSLVALNIPESVFLNDLCYEGGLAIVKNNNPSEECYYNPKKKLEEYKKLFKEYQKFIPRPKFNSAIGFTCEDAKHLSHDTNSFDFIFTDPPYNKNLSSNGIKELINCLPELLRVSKDGVLLMIPENWLTTLENLGSYKVTNLSGALTHKDTTFRTVLAQIH